MHVFNKFIFYKIFSQMKDGLTFDIIDRRFEFKINGFELADFQICELFVVV